MTSISIRPGVVDTEMQRELREIHHTSMDKKDAEKFASLKKNGGLLKPEQPGHVMAKLAVDAPKELSGRFLRQVTRRLYMLFGLLTLSTQLERRQPQSIPGVIADRVVPPLQPLSR